MNMKSLYLSVSVLLFLLSWLPPEAIAAPSVTIAPVSDSAYAVQGNDFSDASGMDITIVYDSTALAGPQVAQGGLVGGALMATNASTPGMLRLALVRVSAINGSGAIATVNFTRLKSTGADIQSLSSVALVAGKNTSVPSQIVNAPKKPDTDSTVTTAEQQQSGQPASGSSSSVSSVPADTGKTATTPTVIVGMVAPSSAASTDATQGSISSTSQAVPDMTHSGSETRASSEAVKETSKETVVAKAVEPELKKIMMSPSVLERFKEFKGEKTPEALMALFGTQDRQAKQDPPIVLSDGKTTVKIVVELNSGGENNNLVLDGVSLVSLKNKEKNLWIAELLPDTRTFEATVSIPGKGQLYIMPLTVASPMDVNASRLTEADFKLYLKEKGTIKTPRFDLNGDGVRNYIDDYIFTANYLVQQQSSGKTWIKGPK